MTVEVQDLLEQKSLDIIYKGAATAPLGNMYLPSLLDRIAATYSGPGAIGLGGIAASAPVLRPENTVIVDKWEGHRQVIRHHSLMGKG